MIFVTPAPGNEYACKGAAGEGFGLYKTIPNTLGSFGGGRLQLPASKQVASEKAECTIVRSTKHRVRKAGSHYSHPAQVLRNTLGHSSPLKLGAECMKQTDLVFYLKIYLAVPGLSCSMQHANS